MQSRYIFDKVNQDITAAITHDLNTQQGRQLLLELLEEAHLIVVDPDSDNYFDGNRLDNLLIRSIKLLKGEPL